MKPVKAFVYLIISGLISFSCGEDRNKRVIKLAHGLDVTHSVHKAMVFMADHVKRNSEDKLNIQIYPNQQLGTERQALELLQIGTIGMTKTSAAVLESFNPAMRVLSLPYLFRDKDHLHKVLDGDIGNELLLGSQKFWLRGLCFYDAGSRSFYTKDQAIKKPEDLEGLKIRVQPSNTALTMVRMLGGSATPISWGELYTALQQGIVDGAENNPPSFYLSRHYEICKFYSLNEHTFVPDVLVISTHLWEKLSSEEKQWLNAAVQASLNYQRELWEESEKEALNEVKKAGVQVIYPDKTRFAEKLEEMLEIYKEDSELSDYINRIKNIQ